MSPKKFANSFKKILIWFWGGGNKPQRWLADPYLVETRELQNFLRTSKQENFKVFIDWQQKLLLKTDVSPPPLPESLGQ